MTPYFFGYGSLVNSATHTYPDTRPARLAGWRRAWVRTASRDVVFLTVVQDKSVTIDGLVAAVPDADWTALDRREAGYARHLSGASAIHDLDPATEIAHYAIPPTLQQRSGEHVILLSYLDVVVQGFLHRFGPEGVRRFFDTTLGWDTAVRDDRLAPVYPRHQQLKPEEMAVVDLHLERVGARIVT